jgi:hypothetical protein
MKKTFFWIIGGVAVWYLIKKATLLNKIQFYLNKAKVSGSLFRPVIQLEYIIENPTNNTAELKSIVGEVFVNDQFVARFSKFGSQTIDPNAQSPLLINAVPVLTGVFSAVKDLLTQPAGSGVRVRTTGTANVNKIVLPFDQTITL